MPFKSESQRRKFYSMAAKGEISKAEVDKWEAETGDAPLPEKVASERAAFITNFVKAFYKGAAVNKQEFEASDSGQFVKDMAGILDKHAAAADLVAGEVLAKGLPNIQKLLWTGIGSFAAGTGAGMYAGKTLSPSSKSIDNLRKQETLTELDKAIEQMRWRMANRVSKQQQVR